MGWFRLWIVASLVWLLIITAKVGDHPRENPRVSYQLTLPEAVMFKRMPDGFRLEDAPDRSSPVYELAYLNYSTGTILRSQEDYASYLRSEKITFLLHVFSAWAVPSVLALALGIGIAWIVKGFRLDSQAKKV